MLFSEEAFQRATTAPQALSGAGSAFGWAYSIQTGMLIDGTTAASRASGMLFRSGSGGQRMITFPHLGAVLTTQHDHSMPPGHGSFTGSASMIAVLLGGPVVEEEVDED